MNESIKHLKAFGFKPATCCIPVTILECKSCNRLYILSGIGVMILILPSRVPNNKMQSNPNQETNSKFINEIPIYLY